MCLLIFFFFVNLFFPHLLFKRCKILKTLTSVIFLHICRFLIELAWVCRVLCGSVPLYLWSMILQMKWKTIWHPETHKKQSSYARVARDLLTICYFFTMLLFHLMYWRNLKTQFYFQFFKFYFNLNKLQPYLLRRNKLHF